MKENKRTRNQNEEGMEKCEEKRDEERKKSPKRGNVGDANGRKVEDALQDLTIHINSLEDEDEDRAIYLSNLQASLFEFWIASDGCND